MFEYGVSLLQRFIGSRGVQEDMSQEIDDLTSFIQRQQQERNRREMMASASASTPDETKTLEAFTALNSPVAEGKSFILVRG